jgi:hypothetical protein
MPANMTKKEQTQQKIMQELLDASESRSKRWMESGNSWAKNATFLDREDKIFPKIQIKSAFTERMPKAAEALQVFLPRVSIDRGLAKVTPRFEASESRKEQLACGEELVNTLAKINNRFRYHSMAVKDLILRGRGVRLTALSEDGVVYSPHIPAQDFIIDSNSDDPAGAAYEGHYEIIPRWKLLEEVGDDKRARAKVLKLEPWTATNAESGSEVTRRRTISAKYGDDKRVDCVRIARLYFRYGLHRYRRGLDAASTGETRKKDDTVEVDDTPKLYIVDAKTKQVIQERGWEIPFHLNPFDPFPYTRYDTPGMADDLWPFSVLEAGRPYLLWMNRLLVLTLGKTKTTMRLLLAMKQGLNQKAKDKIFHGQDIDILEIPGQTGGKTLKQFIEQFQWSNSDMQYAMMLLDRLDYYYSLATGMSSVLYTGDLGRQMRSAEEAAVVREMSGARTEQIRAAVLDAESRNFKKEAFACRALYDKNRVAVFVGPETAEAWGVLVPEGGVPQIAMTLAQQMGVPVEQILPMVEAQFAGQRPVSFSEWIYAADFKIEAGSTLRENFEHARALGDAMLNQPFAAMMRLADSNPIALPLAYNILPAVAKLNQWPDEYLQILEDGKEFAQTMAQMIMQQQQQQEAAAAQEAEAQQQAAAQQQANDDREFAAERVDAEREAEQKDVQNIIALAQATTPDQPAQ